MLPWFLAGRAEEVPAGAANGAGATPPTPVPAAVAPTETTPASVPAPATPPSTVAAAPAPGASGDHAAAVSSATAPRGPVVPVVSVATPLVRRDLIRPLGDQTVPAGTKAVEAVVLGGDITVEGEIERDAIALAGDVRVGGRVGGEALALLGNVSVEGHVQGAVIVLLGTVHVGPRAKIDGGIVTLWGQIERSPEAAAGIRTVQIGGDSVWQRGLLGQWLQRYVLRGRLLGFTGELGWAWFTAGWLLLLYLLLALVSRPAVETCAGALEQRAGITFLAGLAVLLALPLLVVLLAVTGVGLLLLPFLVAGLVGLGVLGRIAVLAALGRMLTRRWGDTWLNHASVSVVLGGMICLALYNVPVLGGLLWLLIGLLGWGAVALALGESVRRQRSRPESTVAAANASPSASPAGASAALPVAPPLGSAVVLHGSPSPLAVLGSLPVHTTTTAPTPAAPPPPPPGPTPAGFWERLGALAIDLLLVALLVGLGRRFALLAPYFGVGAYLVLFALYCLALWRWGAATIGARALGLRLVRLDQKPLDATTLLVRALGGCLSAALGGIGFLWLAVDARKQTWHDHIAGTTLIRHHRQS